MTPYTDSVGVITPRSSSIVAADAPVAVLPAP